MKRNSKNIIIKAANAQRLLAEAIVKTKRAYELFKRHEKVAAYRERRAAFWLSQLLKETCVRPNVTRQAS